MNAPPLRIAALEGRPVGQVGILVRDLERALDRYSTLWGLSPWRLYTYGPEFLPRLVYRGEPGRYRMRIALAGSSPQIELIESLDGPSIYEEWLEEHGEGLHHVGVFVPSVDEAVKSVVAAGYGLLQAGWGYGVEGDGGFAYFDTARDFGVVIETIEVPARRREPEAVRG